MAQCMNALGDKVHKQEVPFTQWYALRNMATLFNNQVAVVSCFCTLWLMRHPCTCVDKWRPTASTLCPLSLPRKKVQMVSSSYAQSKPQKDHLQRISWLLVAVSNATCIALWHYRLVEEERKKEDEQFWLLTIQVCHLKIVTTLHYYYCRLGQAL